jgi:WD40 repeat protein
MAEKSPSPSKQGEFDAYHKWLGIPPKEQPPNHYRLLSLNLFESDGDVIDAAANRQSAFLRHNATGPYGEQSQKLLNEVSEAQICLLVPEQKAKYDKALREEVAAREAKSNSPETGGPNSSSSVVKIKTPDKEGSIFKDENKEEASNFKEDDQSGGTYSLGKKTRKKSTVADKPEAVKMSDADIRSFYRLSLKCIEKYDYSQVVELLQEIPRGQRGKTVQNLLEKAVRLEQQSDSLSVEMNDAFALEDYDEALSAAKQLLKLKPGHRRAKEIIREISQLGPRRNRRRQQQSPRKAGLIPPVVTKLAIASVLIGGVVWGGMQLMNVLSGSGKNGEREVAESGMVRFKIDDAFREAKLTVFIDGNEFSLADLEKGIELKTGRHPLEAKNGDKVVHTKEISVDPDNMPVISLTFADGKVGGTAVVKLDSKTLKLPDGKTGAVRVFEGHTGDIRNLSFSPSGRYLASAGYDRSARLWNVETGAEIRSIQPGNYVTSVSFAPDGKTLVLNGDRSNSFRVWDLETGQALREFQGHTGQISAVAFSPNGKLIVSAGGTQPDGSVRVWDAATGTEKWKYNVNEQSAGSVSFSPDGNQVLAVIDGIVVALDAGTGRRLRLFDGTGPARFSGDGSVVLTKSNTQNPQLWNAHTGVELRTLPEMTYLGASAFSTIGPFAAFSSNNRNDLSITLWDTVKGKKIATFEGHTGAVYSLVFSPDGRFLASGSRDKTIRLWRLPNEATDGSVKFETVAKSPKALPKSPLGEVRTFNGAGTNPGVSADGKFVVTTYGGFVKVWNIETGGLAFKSLAHNATHAAISVDSNYVVSAGGTSLYVWEMATGRELQRITAPGTAILGLSYPAGNRRLLATVRLDRSPDSTVAVLFDLETSRELQRFPSEGTVGILQAEITPDGNFVAAIDLSGKSAQVFEVATDRALHTLSLVEEDAKTGLVGTGVRIGFSPDSSQLVISGADRITRLWEIQTGKQLGALTMPSSVYGLDLSPDGSHLLTCGGEVRLYDAAGNRFSKLFGENAKTVRRIKFVPGGEYAVSTGSDYALRVWRIPDVHWPTSEEALSGETLDFTTAEGEVKSFQAHSRDVRRLVFSPDGKTLVSTSGSDANARLWEVASGSEKQAFQTEQYGGGGIAFSQNGESLITGQSTGSIIDWNIGTGNKTVWSKGHAKAISDMAISPDGQFLATASGLDAGSLRLWDIARGEERWRYDLTQQRASSVAFTPDGTQVFAEIDGVVMLIDAETGQRRRVFDGTGPAALSPRGGHAVTSGPDTLRLWDTETGREVQRLRGFPSVPTSMAFSPDGRFLVTGQAGKTALQLWDVSSGKSLMQRQIEGGGSVTTVAFAPDKDLIAYGTNLGMVGLWELPALPETPAVTSVGVAKPGTFAISKSSNDGPGELGRITLPGYAPSAPVVSSDGQFVAVVHNYAAKVWNIQTGELLLKSVPDTRNRLAGVALSHDGSVVLTRTAAGIDQWEISSGKRKVLAAVPNTSGFALSPDGKHVLIFSGSGKNQGQASTAIHDVETGKKTFSLQCNAPGRYPLAVFSPDSQIVAVVDGPSVRLFDPQSGNQLRELTGHTREIASIPVFSDDGERLFTYGSDRTVRQWDVAKGTNISTGEVRLSSIALGPDGTFLSPSTTGLTMFKTANAEELSRVDTRLGRTTYLRYIPGGEFAVSTGDDNTIRTWRLPPRRAGASK